MSSERKKILFGVIGVGHIGKRHLEMIRRNSHAELVCFCDIKDFEELGIEEDAKAMFYRDASQMLKAHPELDVVCVATPNGLHSMHALAALEAQNHVLIEKPMALTKSDCEQIIHKSFQVSRQVFCVMQNRYSPQVKWIKQVVEEKLLGEIFMVQINCYWNRDDRYYKKGSWKGTQDMDGGTLFTQFSHFIDIMYWLFGDITHIQAKFFDFAHQHSTDFEDSGIVNFAFVNGGLGSINYSTAVWGGNFESSMTIIGEKGTAKIGGQYMNEVVYCNIENYTMPALPEANPANDYGHYKGSANNHPYVFENVIETIKGNSHISTNALEGLKVVEIIEKIYSLKN